MTSHQLLSAAATMPQVTGSNLAKGTPHLPNNSKHSAYPSIANLLNNISTIGLLAQIVHEQILNHDTSVTSNADRYEKAYFAEHYKLQRASETSNAMGREIEILHTENAKYKEIEETSKRLNEDLAAYDARNRELDDLNTQIEVRNEELEDLNIELEEMIVNLREQAEQLWAEEEQQDGIVDSAEQATAADEKDPGLATGSDGTVTATIRSPERLQSSQKRKHREVGDESEEEPRKTRRRK